MKETRLHLSGRKLAGLAIIPVSLILIVLFSLLDIRTATEPPYLLTILNTVFIGIIPIVIAVIAFRGYRSSGMTSLSMMGGGMLVFGLASIAAGWLIGLPDGANISVTIYNFCIFISALFYFSGALLTFSGSSPPVSGGTSWKIAAITAGIVIFVAVFIILTVAGLVPPFFIAGVGPTALRQIVLSNAIVVLALTSLLLFRSYMRKREDFFFWYSLSLMVIAIGLVAAFLIPALGSPVNWVSRAMQYIGAGFALVALLVARRQAQDAGTSIEEILGRFFSEAEAGYRSLVETATDAIVVFDSADRVIVWNRGAETIFGYSEAEAIGSSFTRLVVPDETARIIKNNFKSLGVPGADSSPPKPVELTVRRKDGSAFPAELTLTRQIIGGTEVSTCIIRDLTNRKHSEHALKESESILQSFFNVQGAMRGIVEVIADDDVRHLMDNVVTAGFIGRTPEALKNMRGSEIGEPSDILRIWVGHYRESQRTANPVSFEYLDKRGDHQAWLQATVSYLGTPPGGCPRFAYVVTDITGHKMAEEKLRYHANLIETISDAVISTDTGLTILSWNKAAETVYGWRSDEVLGRNGSEILMTEFPEGTDREAIIRDLLEKGIWRGELIQRTKAGNMIIVEATSIRLKDETGRTIGAVSVSRNITERKRAEEVLAFQARLLSEVHDAVFSSDTAYSITYWNQAAEKMLGWTKDEVLGKNSGELLKPRVAGSTRDYERSRLMSAGHWEGEVRYVRKDGTDILVEVNSTVLNDASGNDAGRLVVARDITDRKHAEDALRESEEKFRVLTQNLQSAVALIDEHGAFSIVNASFLRLFGIPADADILNVNSQDWARWQVFNEDGTQLDVDQHPVRKAAMTGRAVKNQLVAMKSPAGPELKWLLISAEPILDEHGGIHRIICTYYDITERKKAEEELQKKNEDLNVAFEEITSKEEELQQNIEELSRREKDLNKALAEKEVLLSEIHHRVKNNLTAFISLLSLEGSIEETPAGKQLKVDLQNRARSMALVHETLYKTHKFDEVDMKVYLSTLVEQIVNSYQSPKSLRTLIDVEDISLDLNRATPIGLIINELVTNSLKYAFPQGTISCRADQKEPCTIRIRLTKEDGTYLLKISDNGVGLPKGLDIRTTKSLGLKLVNFLASHQLRAKLEIDTKNGTEFAFRFEERGRK